ncbi:MAG TPA: BamA/TamA family outer membrane protein [Gemmatimonadaceae bacterium]|nr:BamA/TamA family outer membrane protein [Gemmatimonadaceae bacterium]
MKAAGLAFAVGAALAAPCARALAQDLTCGPRGSEVASLTFRGNATFTDATLESGIVTTPSSWGRRYFSVLGKRRCLDRQQFALDVVRLLLFYHNHGYASASVDTLVAPAGAGRVAITFTVREGEPTRVTDLVIEGGDSVPGRAAIVRDLAVAPGRPFDKYAIQDTRDTLTRRLHNAGYPDAEVFVGYDTRVATNTAIVRFTLDPGPQVRIGPVRIEVTTHAGAARGLGDDAVLRVAGIADGDLYSEQRLERAKRTLYQTEAYDLVAVRADSASDPTDPGRRGVTLALTEGYMHVVSGGVGYGTLDCFRATGGVTKYNLLGGAARLDVNARVSKIGIGDPLAGAAELCPQAKADPYSRDLNYYASASASRSAVFREFAPSVTLYSERRSEYKSFLRTTPIGGTIGLSRTAGGTTQALGYSVEYGKTEAQPALLCAVFNACEESDRAAFERSQRLAVASVSVAKASADNLVDPTLGSSLRAEIRTAARFIGSDAGVQFNKMLLDGAIYRPIADGVVLAARLRMGAVVGPSLSFSNAALYVPPHERLFAGGPTTVRGFGQNELGPAVYIAAAYDTVRANGARGGDPANPADTVYFRAVSGTPGERTVPTGGNALVVANLEARFHSPFLPDVVQWTAFADVGEVWNRGTPGANLGFNALRWTPGAGVRVRTLIGFIRLDVAYNPYARPGGAAYFDTPVAAGGALLCVSPANTLRVTATGDGHLSQAAGSCPGSYVPPSSSAFLRRLTPSISIGQAF